MQRLGNPKMSVVLSWCTYTSDNIHDPIPLDKLKNHTALLYITFPFDRCLEMCLQKGYVLCICSGACNLPLVSCFGVASGVSVILVISGVAVSVLGCGVRFSVMLLCAVLLLVWNVGPSRLVVDSIWTVACLSCGSSTILESQSAALFWAPNIHLKVMLYVASSKPHLFTLLFAFCPLGNLAGGLWSFCMITSAPWRQ